MKRSGLAAGLALCLGGLLISGCLVRSTEPWLTDATRIATPSLGGVWQDEDETTTAFFTVQGSNYLVRLVQEGRENSFFTASLHRVDQHLLLEVGPASDTGKMDAFVQMPVRLLFNAALAGDTLQLFGMSLDAAPARIRASALAPALSGSKEKGFLLTAPAADLAAFVRNQVNAPDLFQTNALFHFRKLAVAGNPAAAPAPAP
jgi:hypothetical protein